MIQKIISYSNLLVLNEDLTKVVLLTKKSGPSFLIGLDNFPGGKINNGEESKNAASREFFEETGLLVKPNTLTLLEYKVFDDSELYTYAATVPDCKLIAITSMTEEPVRIENVNTYLKNLNQGKTKAAPDIGRLIQKYVEEQKNNEWQTIGLSFGD